MNGKNGLMAARRAGNASGGGTTALSGAEMSRFVLKKASTANANSARMTCRPRLFSPWSIVVTCFLTERSRTRYSPRLFSTCQMNA